MMLHTMRGKSIAFAPMLKVTTPHYLVLLSLMSRHMHLYSEMIIARTVLDAKQHDRIFVKQPIANPLALQLAGDDPLELGAAAKVIAHHQSYDEINLNAGCPSKRASAGNFGIALMEDPNTVARCLCTMKDATNLKISLKCRIGINEENNGDMLRRLLDEVLKHNACDKLILHARPAIMKLKPKQNWEIPSLNYPLSFAVRREYPELEFIVNGGISDLAAAKPLLEQCDGVMIGRAFEACPTLSLQVDDFLETGTLGRSSMDTSATQRILHLYLDYCHTLHDQGFAFHPHYLFIPLMHCFHKQVGARKWRIGIGKIIQKRPPLTIPDAVDKIRTELNTLSQSLATEEDAHRSNMALRY